MCPQRENPKTNIDTAIASVYRELEKIAAGQLKRERAGHTLTPSALVNEVYLRLAKSDLTWNSSEHFFAIAANAMRQLLLNHAIARLADKRGGGWQRMTLTIGLNEHDSQNADAQAPEDVIDLDAALTALEARDKRQAKIVALRYFAGLSIEDTAKVMALSVATIKRDWLIAKLFLRAEIDRQ